MRITSLFSTLAALGLVTCTGVSVVSDQRGGPYGAEEYAKAGAQGPLPVLVYGSAAGTGGRALTDSVVQAMAGADWGYHARFAAASAPDPASVYWYVMLFEPPSGTTTAEACAHAGQSSGGTMSSIRSPAVAGVAPGAAGAGSVRLAAGLCRYDKIASSVQARVADVRGIDDPKFRTLVRTSVLELTRPNQSRFDRSRDNGGSDHGGGNNQP